MAWDINKHKMNFNNWLKLLAWQKSKAKVTIDGKPLLDIGDITKPTVKHVQRGRVIVAMDEEGIVKTSFSAN